jgi:hypothetical protein
MLTSVKGNLTWLKKAIQKLSQLRRKRLIEKWKQLQQLPGEVNIISYRVFGSGLAGQSEGLKALTTKFSQALHSFFKL